METVAQREHMTEWVSVCHVAELPEQAGVAALLPCQRQAAVFLADGTLYAVSNVDPFGHAAVLARGIVGDADGVPVVTSPLYKHRFDLSTGQCLDEPATLLPTYPVAVHNSAIHIGLVCR